MSCFAGMCAFQAAKQQLEEERAGSAQLVTELKARLQAAEVACARLARDGDRAIGEAHRGNAQWLQLAAANDQLQAQNTELKRRQHVSHIDVPACVVGSRVPCLRAVVCISLSRVGTVYTLLQQACAEL